MPTQRIQILKSRSGLSYLIYAIIINVINYHYQLLLSFEPEIVQIQVPVHIWTRLNRPEPPTVAQPPDITIPAPPEVSRTLQCAEGILSATS